MGTTDGRIIGTTKIVDHGSVSDRFNLVLVAEGYREDELALFAADVQQFVQHMFTSPPFDELQCAFNIFRIDVVSDESGADDPIACGGTGIAVATYFDASFCHSGIRRLLMVNTQTVLNLVNSEVPEWHQTLVIVNSSVWGGAGGTIGVSSVAPGWENIALHEMGHALFGLADEYPYWSGCDVDTNRDHYTGPEPIAPNVTINTDRETIKWGNMILSSTPVPSTSNPDCSQCDAQVNPLPDGTVGVFEGACYYHCGIYRPEYNCMMRNLSAFCAVCQKQIIDTMIPFIEDCYAPTFRKHPCITCFFFLIIYSIVIAVLIIPALFSDKVKCKLRGFIFRIRNCCKGNADKCIPL